MTTLVMQELERIISLVESKIPANPNSENHVSRAGKLQRKLSSYFNKLADAFPYHKLGTIYSRYITESLGADTGGIIDPMLSSFTSELEAIIAGELAEVYFEGSAEMVSWGQTKAGVPITYEGPPISEAVKWSKAHSAKQVTLINATTKDRLARSISDGIKNKLGVPGIGRDIRNNFGNMTKYRSELIAKTETRQALFQASHDRSVEMGVTGKEWILGSGGQQGNCDACIGNADQGVIPINQDFYNPEDTIHPGCTCAIAPAMLKGDRIAEQPIQQAEQDFITKYSNSKIEHSSAFDNNGKLLAHKSGGTTSVRFTRADLDAQFGARSIIHNHPGYGGSFSADDLIHASRVSPGQAIVFDKQLIYRLTPTKKWSEIDIRSFANALKGEIRAAKAALKIQDKLHPGTPMAQRAEFFHNHIRKVTKQLAPKYGFEYKLETR